MAERIQQFTANLVAQSERNGSFPTELMLRHPEAAFDDIVIRLTLQALADEMGQVISIVWVGKEHGPTTKGPLVSSKN